jgi:GTP diphosphokinase / guanosine-3',5'-bis(diphosphate) 3'-diphosphatase
MRKGENIMITNSKIILNKAAIFAVKSHAGHFRKDGVTPYVTHPLRVANLLALHRASDTEILCGLWHDILEDIPEKREDLMNELASYNLEMHNGIAILEILGSVCKPSGGNRTSRNKEFIEQIIRGGKSAIMVKICDRIDNVMDSGDLEIFAEEYVVNETGYLMQEFSKIDLKNTRCESALYTLGEVRKEMMEKNGWVENK